MSTADGSADAIDTFGSFLRYLRRRARLTQSRLAAAVGYSEAHVCRLERGRRPPDLNALRALFLPALGLQQQHHLVDRLLELAAAERGSGRAPISILPSPPGQQPPAPGGRQPTALVVRRGSARRRATVVPALSVFRTSFVGREQELAAISTLLQAASEVRLLTLIGPPGTGKTRLALEVAARVQTQYPDGVAFVDLSAVSDAAAFPTVLAHVLGIRDTEGLAILDSLLAYLAGKHLLLILDNFEQILMATPWLTKVLAACPALRLLVTSRTPLKVRGEHEYPVPPLLLPPPTAGVSLADLSGNPAVALFLQRGQAVRPSFALTAANVGTVAAIVRRLDGLPLAIELAAARVKLLTPAALLGRLEHPLDLLVDGARDLPPRQQTLRRTLAWSCALLEPEELVLFRRLAVFAGGGTLEAIERVCSGDGLEAPRVLDVLARLVDHSLVQVDLTADEPRYRLLVTTLEYAAEQLAEAGETESLRQRHRDWCLTLAEQAGAFLHGPDQHLWLKRLASELDNLRRALAQCGEADAELGLRLAIALVPFWERRGIVAAGRRILEGLLAQAPAFTPWRGRALLGAGALASAQGDRRAARPLLEESLDFGRERNDRGSVAWALLYLGDLLMVEDQLSQADDCYAESFALFQELGDGRGAAWARYYAGFLSRIHADYDRTVALWEQSLSGFRAAGDLRGVGAALRYLAQVASTRAEYARARLLLEESLALERTGGDKPAIGWTLSLLGNLARVQGRVQEALVLLEESLALFEELGDQRKCGVVLHHMANAALDLGDVGAARSRYEASLALYRATDDARNIARVLGDLASVCGLEGDEERERALWLESLLRFRASGTNRWGTSWTLGHLGRLAIRRGDAAGGVQLIAAAEAIHPDFRSAIDPDERASCDAALAIARSKLGTAAFASAWAAGQRTTAAQVVALASASGRPPSQPTTRGDRPADRLAILTPRELEVATLVARGCTSRRIAKELVIAEGTAALHVEHIREKLGFHSRAQIATWAVERGLLATPDH